MKGFLYCDATDHVKQAGFMLPFPDSVLNQRLMQNIGQCSTSKHEVIPVRFANEKTFCQGFVTSSYA